MGWRMLPVRVGPTISLPLSRCSVRSLDLGDSLGEHLAQLRSVRLKEVITERQPMPIREVRGPRQADGEFVEQDCAE